MSRFIAKILDTRTNLSDIRDMGTSANKPDQQTMRQVRDRIEHGGERLWRYEDFTGLPFTSVAQALSRLARSGLIQRLSKGTYYHSRQTAFGPSRPNPAALRNLAARTRPMFPAGIAAANLVGFTTQNPSRPEIATTELSLPRKLIGADAIVHSRRPAAWKQLSQEDAALLDFLRQGGKSSELSSAGTIRKLLALFSHADRFERLMRVAPTEPPRVRAMIGAIGQQMGQNAATLAALRESLNPLSRFEFGLLTGLRYARSWQAKESSGHEAVSTP